MIHVVFFLRFRSQLHRIRPDIVSHLEDTIVRAVEEAGGKINKDRALIQAVFDENSLGVWLDILLLIETLTQVLEETAGELYGWALLVGKSLPETIKPICRFLSGEKGGMFFDNAAARAMSPYITVDDTGSWTETSGKYGIGPLFRLKAVKIFIPTSRYELPLTKPNAAPGEKEQYSVVFIAGQSFEGKRDKLYQRVAGDDCTPLCIRFGSGGLNAIIDSRAEWMKIAEIPSVKDKLNADWNFLFRQRLREKPSPFAIRIARGFFAMLLDSYRSYAQTEGKAPVIIIENIDKSEQTAADIIIETLCECRDFILVGTRNAAMSDTDTERWIPLFPQLATMGAEEPSLKKLPELPLDLWEIAYALSLLGQYFPSDMLPQLLEESGKSPRMISRAISLLYALRVIDTPLDPGPWHKDFQLSAENALGDRKDAIRSLVRARLLAWVERQKIDPCLRLLGILKELDSAAQIDDKLILQSIHAETAGIEEAALESIRYNKSLEIAAGPLRAPLLRYILETLIALYSGSVHRIRATYANPAPESSAFPLLNAQVLLNQSLYYLGRHDNDNALEAVKEASLLCKGSEGSCLAQAYRLFALENLSRRRMSETIDYLGFALEIAGKSGGFADIGMAAYYAASVQFLYGNLSRSQTLAEKAYRHFIKAGSPEWADRSHFLLGRIAFEIGSYQQAVEIFDDIRQMPQGADAADKISLLEAWAYRAKICGSLAVNPDTQISGRDSELFEIEACCLAGNFTKAAELCVILGKSPGRSDFMCLERPDWRSGFSQCELLYCNWNDLRDRMLSAYHSIAQCKEAINAMQRILRSNQIPEFDPYDVFFHYVWYRVLKQAGSSQVDISTAVSVAYKHLQSRAGRIDDSEMRRQYLTQPRWNIAIEKAAREFKLV